MRVPCHISRRIGQIAYLSTPHDYVGIWLTRLEEDPYDLNLLVECYLIAGLHLRQWASRRASPEQGRTRTVPFRNRPMYWRPPSFILQFREMLPCARRMSIGTRKWRSRKSRHQQRNFRATIRRKTSGRLP